MDQVGKTALRIALEDEQTVHKLIKKAEGNGYHAIRGKVGSMKLDKVIAAIETAAKREGLISDEEYSEAHALYHATIEALYGICRGELVLGDILRTVGLAFSIAKGPRAQKEAQDDLWIAVVLYGTIGAPIKGFEHESIGLGINHISKKTSS